MKKVTYILAIIFTFSIISGVAFAKTETEYDKAIRYYNTGKYREAVEIFKDYIKTEPEAPAYYRIGYALYELGEYAEANQYFQQAYLIDPSFSPDIVAPKIKTQKIAKPPIEQATAMKEPQVPTRTEIQSDTAPSPVPGTKPQMQMEPHKQQEQVAPPVQQPLPGKSEPVPAGKEAPSKEAQVVTPQRVQPPAGFPEFPKPPEGMPTALPGIPGGLGALMAGFGMIMIVIEIVSLLLYLFACYCIFLIAKKLDIPAPWLAFIPIVQIWTIVSCAGKPWWWILLLFIPLVGFIVGIVIWMSITENMGRNKWLGLLMLLPIVNFIFLAMLAFSKSEGIGPAEGITTA
jgi:hypothetical protein